MQVIFMVLECNHAELSLFVVRFQRDFTHGASLKYDILAVQPTTKELFSVRYISIV